MNTPDYREIEKKFRVNTTLKKAHDVVMLNFAAVPKDSILLAETRDEYWEVPGKGQFLRLRHSWGESLAGTKRELKELTAKAKDKGSNLNRLEINLAVDGIIDARALLQLVLGNPIGRVSKREYVYFLPGRVVLSLSEVNEAQVYLEVEGPSVASVQAEMSSLRKAFPGLEAEPQSLFELYVRKD